MNPLTIIGREAYHAQPGDPDARWDACAEAVKAAVLADLPPVSPWRSVDDPPENHSKCVVLYSASLSVKEALFSDRSISYTHWAYPPKQDTPEEVSAKEFDKWWRANACVGTPSAAWQAARGFGGAK